MSDTGEARPGARAPATGGAKPPVPNRPAPGEPKRSPSVTDAGRASNVPTPASRAEDIPESGWDEAEPDDAMPLPSSAVILAAEDTTSDHGGRGPAEGATRDARAVAPPIPPRASAGPAIPRAASSPDLAPIARRARSLPDLGPSMAPRPPPRQPSSPALGGETSVAPRAPVRQPSSPMLGGDTSVAPRPPRARSSPDLQGETAQMSRVPAPAGGPVAAAVAPAAATPAPAPVAAAPAATDPAATTLSQEAQEQIFGVLAAALDASLAPLLEKQRELEARIESLKQEAARAAAAAAAAPVRSRMPSLSVDVTPTASASVPPKAVVVNTSYGLVMTPSVRPRPPMEEELANVGPIDLPDFGKRNVARVLVALLLAGVAAAIAAMALSYT